MLISTRPKRMSLTRLTQSAVVDTDVVSFAFKGDSRADLYGPHLTNRLLVISFMTLAELERWSLERLDRGDGIGTRRAADHAQSRRLFRRRGPDSDLRGDEMTSLAARACHCSRSAGSSIGPSMR
jgi:hypothetical protein